ncbi:MAG: hypothetical protein AB1480_03890 [Nitrospirota bacterium]
MEDVDKEGNSDQLGKGKSSMPEGICPKCGRVYFGWGLLHGHNKCDCGEELVIEGPEN